MCLGLILLARVALSWRRKGELARSLWPQFRRVGVTVAGGAPIALSDLDSSMIIMLAVVDMFFRSAAYAHPEVRADAVFCVCAKAGAREEGECVCVCGGGGGRRKRDPAFFGIASTWL